MNMNLSPRKLWINSNAQLHNMHINLIAHSQVKIWNPTPECQTRFIHMWKFFKAFSRAFQAFSHFWVLRCFCMFLYSFDNFGRNNEDMIFRPPTTISDQANIGQARLQRPSFKPVAPWQVAGNIFFYSLEGSIYETRCTSFCYTIMMLMGGLGYP